MKQILLLEDLPEIRAYLRALVLQVFPGSTVIESARIADALQQVGAHRFDLRLRGERNRGRNRLVDNLRSSRLARSNIRRHCIRRGEGK